MISCFEGKPLTGPGTDSPLNLFAWSPAKVWHSLGAGSCRAETCGFAFTEGAAAGRSAYIRYVVPTPDDEEATVEYDLDEEDEEWLQQHNHKVPELSRTLETNRREPSKPASQHWSVVSFIRTLGPVLPPATPTPSRPAVSLLPESQLAMA